MLPWIICGILAAIIAILVIKIRMMQKSMDEICSCLSEHSKHPCGNIFSQQLQFCLHFSLNKNIYCTVYKAVTTLNITKNLERLKKVAPFLL